MKTAKQKLPKRIKQKTEKTEKPVKQIKRKPPKSPKSPEALLREAKRREEKPKKTPEQKKSIAKNIIIAVLVVAVIAQSVLLVVTKMKTPETTEDTNTGSTTFAINLDVSGVANTALDAVSQSAVSAIEDIKNNITPQLDIKAKVQEIIYSDAIVNTIMSMSYPLLKTVLTDLDMMDFAENVSLYPTPAALATLLKDTSYSCCNKNGERKPIADVLEEAGDDWEYMDTKISVTDNNGNVSQTTLWNSIVWGVTGQSSFYQAMNDMGEGIRGVLEICMQGKEKIVNINLADFLLKIDKINVGLDAATVFNATGKSGYESCLIPLFNSLGLRDGDYPTVAEYTAYTSVGDMWKGILEPVLSVVDKTMASPLQGLCDMLVNFAVSIEDGSLVESMSTLRMDAEYHELAKKFMGYEDGLLFNLGNALVDIIKSMGIDLTGSFNNLLDSLLQTVLKNSSADMPDMDVAALKACATQTTLSNGNKVWTSNYEQVIDYLIKYAVQGQTIELVLNQTPLAGTPEAEKIVAAIDSSKDGVTELVNVVLDMALEKLQQQ